MSNTDTSFLGQNLFFFKLFNPVISNPWITFSRSPQVLETFLKFNLIIIHALTLKIY